MPFPYEPPQVELGVLKTILEDAPAAFPALLSVGSTFESLQDADITDLRKEIIEGVGGTLDSRLATQYCISLMCAMKVILYFTIKNAVITAKTE